ncbi:MAG: hypothetical protein Q9167_003286 [Letrouitia subvulpina]
MFEWLRGSDEPGVLLAENADQSCIEEPETPAPIFAVRAFKTALFGGPHPERYERGRDQESLEKHLPHSQGSPQPLSIIPRQDERSCVFKRSKTTPQVSPAKGILLTPGTTVARRKTVSFGNLAAHGGATAKKNETISTQSTRDSEKQSRDDPIIDGRRQTTLSKNQFMAQLDESKHRLSRQAEHDIKPPQQQPSRGDISAKDRPNETELCRNLADLTLDLSKPCSRSGQHWKTEFERYHKKSDREMKKIIRYGQAVKSYAERKDQEATKLGEKLTQELEKCAAMEAKVSMLATQLAASRGNDPNTSMDRCQLVEDLTKQTALAIRYKQKAERYRAALRRQNSGETVPEAKNRGNTDPITTSPTRDHDIRNQEPKDRISELDRLRVELQHHQTQICVAENKAEKLGIANNKLRTTLLRVKREMSNYDNRRLRHESNFKQQIEKLKTENKAYEKKLQRLTMGHQELLDHISEQLVRNSPGDQPEDYNVPSTQAARTVEATTRTTVTCNDINVAPVEGKHTRRELHHVKPRRSQLPKDLGDLVKESQTVSAGQVVSSKNSGLVTARRLARSSDALDIWAENAERDTADSIPPLADPAIDIPPVILHEAACNALKEIDTNTIPAVPQGLSTPETPRPTLKALAVMDSSLNGDFPSPEYNLPSTIERTNERKTTTASAAPLAANAPSTVSRTRSISSRPPLGEDNFAQRSNASILSGRMRMPTTSSGKSRLEELPSDRAAAAKARLAERKSLKERKKENIKL